MAKLLNKAPEVYDEEYRRFIKELRIFHDQRGTPFKNIPNINGADIDLYNLYWLVTAHGGSEKVNNRNGWEEFLECFELGESTVNATLALKQIYLRYLDTYEKYHFLGEDEDRDEDWYNDEEDSRTRKQKAQKIQATVPLSYNHSQHNLSDHLRLNYGLSTDIYRRTDYDRLTLSLTSPLPNEQDFAINTCTLLSNEGKHTLKLSKCPRLLDHLLAHAGVYNNEGYQNYMGTLYQESRSYDLALFWRDVCVAASVRQLILKCDDQESDDDDNASENTRKRSDSTSSVSSSSSDDDNEKEDLLNLPNPKQRLDALKRKARREIEKADSSSFFAVGRSSGTQDLTGQRIKQIATIVRNLSFEDDNARVIAENETCLRFCLLCAGSKWSNLNQMGFDILSNVADEIILEDSSDEGHLMEVLMSTVIAGIASMDRFQVISSLDILNKLCQHPRNESYIESVLRGSVYAQLVTYLSLHDIHLLISTLECLYSISSLGETACNSIVRISGAVDALVSLITAEAQSYGPKACVLMRVVEYVPGTASSVSSGSSAATTIQQPRLASTAQGAVQFSQLTPVKPQLVKQQNIIRASPAAVTQVRTIVPSTVQATPTSGGVIKLPINHPIMRSNTNLTPVQVVQTSGPSIVTAGAPVLQAVPRVIIQGSQQPQLQQRVQTVSSPIPIMQKVIQPSQPPQLQPQLQQQTIQIQQKQPPKLQPQQVQPPTPQPPQQPRSQQVSLRISNDEANRQLCLSWLRATYESCVGAQIEQFVMYKQYLASMHKMGKEDVISDQHHAVCVRTLFGGSVGPNRKQMPNGITERHFEGVKVRAVPHPLRLPAPVVQQQLQKQKAAAITNSPSPTPPPTTTQTVNQRAPNLVPISPQSPILTNLLHRKSPDSKNPQATDMNENGQSPLDGILTKDPKEIKTNNNGMLANLLVKDAQGAVTTTAAVLVNGSVMTTTTAPKVVQLSAQNGGGGEGDFNPRKRSASGSDLQSPAPKKIILSNGEIDPKRADLQQRLNTSTALGQIGQPIMLNSSGQIIVGQPTSVKPISTPSQQQQLLIQQQQSVIQPSNNPASNGNNNQKTIIILPYSGAKTTTTTTTGINGGLNGVTSSPTVNGPTVVTSVQPAVTTAVQSEEIKPKTPDPSNPFVCEWSGCMIAFKTPKEVESHAVKTHCPLGSDDIPCLWSRCDGMKRKRFSLMTHLQDRHCHPQLMKLMAVRRAQIAQHGKSDVPLPPAPPAHPGYAPNAALHAIKRHALEFVNPKEVAMRDEKEGPVTKSIRLTSSLILRNLVIYSNLGKTKLRAYESHLSTVALSNVESSRTVSQILYDMCDSESSQE